MLFYIRQKLKVERWSPELISVKGKTQFGDFVSHETIYRYLWMCKKSTKQKYAKDKSLYKYLKHNKRYSKRSKTNQNRGKIPNRTSIEDRPKIVAKRSRVGDLEIDLMMGVKHKPGLIVITDRATIETDLIKTTTKNSNHYNRG